MKTLASLVKDPVVEAILNDDLERSARDVDESITLPPGCYAEPAFYELEREVIFAREWLCVGRVEQVAEVGDHFTATVAGEPIIVVRSSESEIRAMSAVCQHRAMVITAEPEQDPARWGEPPPEPPGNCRVFKCPYHFWTYDLQGQLVAAPEMHRTPGFDKSAISLPAFRCEVWNGFVFVNLDPGAEPLSPRLERLSEWLRNWRVDEMVTGPVGKLTGMPWNWKVMHENSLESYHADRLHQGLHDSVPSDGIVATTWENHEAAIVTRIRAKFRDFSLNPTYRALLPVIETLTDDERQGTVFALIPPTLLVGMNTDSAIYRIVHPDGPGRIDVSFGNLFPRSHGNSRRIREIRKMTTAGLVTMSSQDIPANAAVQKGLQSRYAPRQRYCWQEEPLAHFNKWLVDRYLRAAEEGGIREAVGQVRAT